MMKKIPGFEDYEIDESGNIWSNKSHKFIKLRISTSGYRQVRLYKNGIGYSKLLHRLLGIMFVSNPFNFDTIDHIDKNKLNNNLNNLRWLSSFDNNSLGHIGNKNRLGKKNGDYSRKRSSEVHMGNKYNLGKKRSEETKEKMRLSWSSGNRKPISAESRKKKFKPVICVETNTVYESQTIAGKENKIPPGNISAACAGKIKTAGGYHWRIYVSS